MKTKDSILKYGLFLLISGSLLLTGCGNSGKQEETSSPGTSPGTRTDKLDTSGGEYYDSTGGAGTKDRSSSGEIH